MTATLAPPGEPRRVAYLYLLPGFVVFGAVRAGCRWCTRRGSRCSHGTASRRARGSGFGNYKAIVSDPELRSAFVHALVLLVFYAVLPIAIGLLLAAAMSRARVRGLALFRTILFLPQVIALVVVAVMWRMIYDARRRAAQRGAARDRARRAGAELARRLHARAAVGRADRHVGDVRAGDGAVHRRRAEDPAVAVRRRAVDGAGPVREFFAVTLPGLRGEIAVALTLTTIQALRTSTSSTSPPAAGPGDATTVPAFEVYNRAFKGGDVGTRRRRSASASRR